MAELLSSAAHTDVTFVVGAEHIRAHRCILIARSEYFKGMLTSGLREGQSCGEPISIGECSPEAFRSILHYLYTDQLAFDDEHVIDVMRKAKEMTLERVYNHTARHCRRKISEENVVVWFLKADEYQLEDLRNATFQFLSRNLRAVKAKAKPTLQRLTARPELLMEVMLEAI